MDDKLIRQILNNLIIFEKAYDKLRIVDPINKKIINIKENNIIEINTNCFEFWEKGKKCDNCISINAFNENNMLVKFEQYHDKICMVTAVPVEVDGRLIVVEAIKDNVSGKLFINGDIGVKLETYKVNDLVLKDALTGIYNRYYINKNLPKMLENAIELEQYLSIIITDIDFFKIVNDKYGHLAGDCVLKDFAEVILSCLQGENQWVARYGGEEFLICISNTENIDVVEIAERMRRKIENKIFYYNTYEIKITASFGIYTTKPSKGDKIEKIIESADKKLYMAKNSGRNRIQD